MAERRNLILQYFSPNALYDVEEWEAAVALDPSNIGLRMTLCKVLARHGRYEDGIRQCQEILALQTSGGQLSVSRRLRIVAMESRLRRAMEKRRT